MSDDERTKPTIRLRPNGPLVVEGSIDLVDAQGRRIPVEDRGKGNIALCRCGHSHSKPFCDGSHRSVDFDDSNPDVAD